MSNTATKEQSIPEISTVEEKILLEKQLPFNPGDKEGPTVDLYFHELTNEQNFGQNVLRYTAGIILGAIFFVTLPFIAILIKLSSGEPVYKKVKVPGKRGIVFEQYKYSTEHSEQNKPFFFGRLLKKSKLVKLPSVINVWKGEMNLVGPAPYPAERCNKWNDQLSDFYKRFALKPGYFSVANLTNDNDAEMAQALEEELNYVLNPSFGRDLRLLLGIG